MNNKEVAVLKRTERAMSKSKCEMNLMDTKISCKLMTMVNLIVLMKMTTKVNALGCFGHVLRAEEDNPVRMALHLEVKRKRKKGCPKST